MLSKRTLLILSVLSLLISNVSMAVMCAKLEKVSAGEDHSLALMDDNTLWACGGKIDCYQLGLGGNVYAILSLKQVLGENGVGFLEDVVTFDAGWFHSLAADSNGTLWSWGTNTHGQLVSFCFSTPTTLLPVVGRHLSSPGLNTGSCC